MTPIKVSRKRVAQILRDARDLMNDGGKHWYQGGEHSIRDGEDVYCSIGAIRKVVTNGSAYTGKRYWVELSPTEQAEYDAACDVLAQMIRPTKRPRGIGMGSSVIITFNDATGRKWDTVKRKFTEAARSLR